MITSLDLGSVIPTDTDWVALAEAGMVVLDIGQITPAARKALERAVRQKRLVRWRGYWHPIAGASWGIGPLKTCYGTAAAKALVT